VHWDDPEGWYGGGRREEGSGWGTHVYLWRIHFNIWQNQYNIVKFKNKIKFKKKDKKKEKQTLWQSRLYSKYNIFLKGFKVCAKVTLPNKKHPHHHRGSPSLN